MSPISRPYRIFTVIVIVMLMASAVVVLPGSALPGGASPIQSVRLVANVPLQLFPGSGIVLPIKRIVYVWSVVPGATQYHLQVMQGTTVIMNKYPGAAACVSDSCTVRHNADLANGTYKWRMRAFVAGLWRTYSDWQSFTVSVPVTTTGFYSNFTSDALDWVVHSGVWNLQLSNYLATTGVPGIDPGYTATISHKTDFSTLTYEVRMKREGCAGNSNALAIRGNPVLDSTGWWNTEYTFNYTNTGYFSVWRDYYGGYTALSGGAGGWVYTSAINQGGWNTLKVKADGGSLYYYINDHLVWTGYDTTYASGRVGIAMYRSLGCTGDKLWVDFAGLDTSVTYPPDADLQVEAGDPVPGGTRNTAP
jgi:hypothetical protein